MDEMTTALETQVVQVETVEGFTNRLGEAYDKDDTTVGGAIPTLFGLSSSSPDIHIPMS